MAYSWGRMGKGSSQHMHSATSYFIAAATVVTHLGEECEAVQMVEEYWVMEGYHVREHSQVL